MADEIDLLDMFEEEELHSDLKPWIVETEFGECLKHPLLFMLFFTPQMNKMANKSYLAKKKYVEEAESEGRYQSAIGFYERPHRWDAIQDYQEYLSDQEYWEMLGYVWTDSENICQHRSEALKMMISDRDGRWQHLMDEEERHSFDKLPDVLTIYRGWCYEDAEHGMSWTLDESTANWFASRFAAGCHVDPFVTTGRIEKSKVLAHFLGRRENEIVVDPDDVDFLKVKEATTGSKPERTSDES